MPICRTCRGEYGPIAPSRPPSGTGASKLCPRCGSDVSLWDELDISLPNFLISEGGSLALLPAAAAIAVWLLWIPREQSGHYFPILTAICLGLCALVFFLIYATRFFWWEHRWAAQIYRTSRISIDALIGITAVGGLLLSPLWVLFYTTVGRPVEFLHKALFALVYVVAFVCLTAAVTFGVVLEYTTRLEQKGPLPIFVSTERLLRVVVNGAISSINLPKSGTRLLLGGTPPKPVYEVLQALRIPEDGGIHVLLRECKLVQYPSADGQKQDKWMEMLWRIQADRWGRVQLLRPGSLEPYEVNKRVFREIGR